MNIPAVNDLSQGFLVLPFATQKPFEIVKGPQNPEIFVMGFPQIYEYEAQPALSRHYYPSREEGFNTPEESVQSQMNPEAAEFNPTQNNNKSASDDLQSNTHLDSEELESTTVVKEEISSEEESETIKRWCRKESQSSKNSNKEGKLSPVIKSKSSSSSSGDGKVRPAKVMVDYMQAFIQKESAKLEKDLTEMHNETEQTPKSPEEERDDEGFCLVNKKSWSDSQ